MSVLVVGLSHRTAPISVLERASMSAREAAALALDLCRSDHVLEAVCLVTCNRLEVYAEVSKFHGGVGEVGTALATTIGISLEELTEHLYAHYESAAVGHLFAVAAGLDSMAIGEAQILGQVRSALRAGQEAGSAGREIGQLLQNALRVGKRAHSETRLDQAAPSLVDAGLARARAVLGDIVGKHVLVIGAGAMSGLSVATAARAGAASITVCSRTLARATRLAASVDGPISRAVPVAELERALPGADIVIACAGASGHLVSQDAARAALDARDGQPQVYLDLAVPRDVDPAVHRLDGATVVDLDLLGRDLSQAGMADIVAQAREVVAGEVAAYLAAQRAQEVAPTVVALRTMARSVVQAELTRLEARLGGVDPAVRAEFEQTVHRVVEKLLHAPTVRMKELAAEPGGSSYAEALRTLFNLGADPEGAPLPGREHVVSTVRSTVSSARPSSLPARLRIGTRRSALAMTQTRWLADRISGSLAAAGHEIEVELVEVTSQGDITKAPLSSLGGSGVFVSALREALLDGRIDLAVHSLKDMPTAAADGLAIAAIPVREDPSDVLVSRDGLTLAQLPRGSRIGTGSPRRAAQVRALGYGLQITDIRGNVDTRLRMVAQGAVDGVLLAHAGLLRLGRQSEVTQVLDSALMLPAPGQGALAAEARADDFAVLAAAAGVDDRATRACVMAERALLARLEAGCAAPVGALAVIDREQLLLQAVAGALDGSVMLRRTAALPCPGGAAQIDLAAPVALGESLADELLRSGAAELIPGGTSGSSISNQSAPAREGEP